jgi:hypothetical protein
MVRTDHPYLRVGCHRIISDAARAPDVLTGLEGPQPNPGDGRRNNVRI